MAAVIVLPTLPSFPAVDDLSERGELMAGLSFVEGAASFDAADLGRWFSTHAGLLGIKDPPAQSGPTQQFPRYVAMARWQVILALRGLLSRPADDRFLHAAIFSERVRREEGAWRVHAREDDALSDVVLALFAADVLAHREFHEQNLCVCDVCGRISYHPAATTRAGCPDHVRGSEALSGVKDSGEHQRVQIPPTEKDRRSVSRRKKR